MSQEIKQQILRRLGGRRQGLCNICCEGFTRSLSAVSLRLGGDFSCPNAAGFDLESG